VTAGELSPEDHIAVCALKARYFRLLDAKDWAGWRALFTEDLVVHVAALDQRSVSSRSADDFVATVQSIVAGAVTVHHGYMPELHLDDDGTVHGTWAMSDLVERPEAGRVYRGFGHYHERYRRTADGWCISELHLVRLAEYRSLRDQPGAVPDARLSDPPER
jgi:hypothetical protein